MKFQFAYRDSSNERHDGIVVASSKDDAFKKLRAQGIRPFFVAPVPGILNRLSGIGKRGFAIIVLLFVIIVMIALQLPVRRASPDNVAQESFDTVVNSRTRRQPIGDVAVIDAGIKTGWSDIFSLEGERFLASFAIPGASAGLRNTSEAEIKKALESIHPVESSDSLEARQMISMVEGMKDELRRYIAAGGTIAEYGRELVARQEAEIAHRQRAEHSIAEFLRKGAPEEEVASRLAEYNRQFRRMGIKPLTMPDVNFGGL